MNLDILLSKRIDRNGFVDLPVCSHIEDNIYVSITPAYWQGASHKPFDIIFNFAPFPEMTYPIHQDQVIYNHICYDNSERPSMNDVHKYATAINREQRHNPNQKILVHCEMGINRSNLFLAAAMILKGASAEQAIFKLRERRYPLVLMNGTFRRFLIDFQHEVHA